MRQKRGSLSAFVTGLGMLFISLVGFSFDSGRLVAEYAHLADVAGNAARAGAQKVAAIRSNNAQVDQDEARRAAMEILRSEGVTGTVTVGNNLVIVSVSRLVNFETLRLIGLSSKHVSLTRSASPQVGQ
ncbi:MAG: hypothetical protein LW606_00290 [Ilumatobacteraceae bacterium]|jgi:Flp pilus assembly protein TadG|nr:hypothetical protein [Ilumatobacteraceae bacterium]